MKEKFEKAKEWTKNHKEELQVAAICVGFVAFYAGIIVMAYKVNKNGEEAWAARQQIFADAFARGAQVLPNPDGSFWIIEPKA